MSYDSAYRMLKARRKIVHRFLWRFTQTKDSSPSWEGSKQKIQAMAWDRNIEGIHHLLQKNVNLIFRKSMKQITVELIFPLRKIGTTTTNPLPRIMKWIINLSLANYITITIIHPESRDSAPTTKPKRKYPSTTHRIIFPKAKSTLTSNKMIPNTKILGRVQLRLITQPSMMN